MLRFNVTFAGEVCTITRAASPQIGVGDILPEGSLNVMGADGPTSISAREYFGTGKTILFSVPGAFTPTCSNNHLPTFLERFDDLKAKGVDKIACVSVNDVFVMNEWGKDRGVGDLIDMLSDGSAFYAEKLGLALDLTDLGLGVRMKRTALVIDGGNVSAIIVEQDPRKSVNTDASAVLEALDKLKPKRIEVGDKLPDGSLGIMSNDGPSSVQVADYFADQKVVIFSVPGAFTPTCSVEHLPSFIAKHDEIKGKGVDKIACIACNDVFVMSEWGKDREVGDKIDMLSDGSGIFATSIGLDLDLTDLGLGVRMHRTSMIVDNGVVKFISIEPDPRKAVNTDADAILKAL